MEESFHGAVRKTAARREAAHAGTRQPCVSHVFLGAKGGAGTTTVSVNCAVELARLSKRPTIIVDLKPCLGEVALFLGVRPRFTVLDAIESLHKLDKEFLKELVSKHKSGLDILAGSEQFDRPNAQDAGAIEELLRVLGRTYDHIVIDAGNTHQLVRRRDALHRRHGVPDCQPGRAVDSERAASRRSRAAARRRRRARQDPAQPHVGPEPDRAQADRDGARLRHPSRVHERLPHGVDGAQLGRAARARQPFGARVPVQQLSRASCWGSSRKRKRNRRSGALFSASSN